MRVRYTDFSMKEGKNENNIQCVEGERTERKTTKSSTEEKLKFIAAAVMTNVAR